MLGQKLVTMLAVNSWLPGRTFSVHPTVSAH
jgi:hypothetical protein